MRDVDNIPAYGLKNKEVSCSEGNGGTICRLLRKISSKTSGYKVSRQLSVCKLRDSSKSCLLEALKKKKRKSSAKIIKADPHRVLEKENQPPHWIIFL